MQKMQKILIAVIVAIIVIAGVAITTGNAGEHGTSPSVSGECHQNPDGSWGKGCPSRIVAEDWGCDCTRKI